MNYFLISLLIVSNISFNTNKPISTEKIAENPKLFDKYPSVIHFQSNIINDLVAREKDESITAICDENFEFKGKILQNTQWNEDAQTIAVKLDSFPDDTKLIINIIKKDGKTIYRAHILNIRYPDAFKLTDYGGSKFVFTKILTEKIVTE